MAEITTETKTTPQKNRLIDKVTSANLGALFTLVASTAITVLVLLKLPERAEIVIGADIVIWTLAGRYLFEKKIDTK